MTTATSTWPPPTPSLWRLRRADADSEPPFKQVRGLDDRYGVAASLEVLAWTAATQQHPWHAATLLGAADTLWSQIHTPISSLRHLAGFHDACQGQARDALGDIAFTDAFHHGQCLSSEEAVAYALNEPR